MKLVATKHDIDGDTYLISKDKTRAVYSALFCYSCYSVDPRSMSYALRFNKIGEVASKIDAISFLKGEAVKIEHYDPRWKRFQNETT